MLSHKSGWDNYLQFFAGAQAGFLPSPPDASPPGASFDELATTFTHPSYGHVPFALVPNGSPSTQLSANGTEWSSYNWNLLAAHYNGNLFNLTLTQHMDALDSPNGTMPFVVNWMELEFDVSDEGVVHGFGVRGDGAFWGAGFGVKPLPKKGSVKQRSEVYFERET